MNSQQLQRAIELSALSANNLARMCDRPPMPPFFVAPATDKQLESLTCKPHPLSIFKFSV
ncbi:MAG TPA: hypothetical protein VLA84_22800 [Microcoleus sp.]|nr:hypothetical protein [Microcoleus sp.]